MRVLVTVAALVLLLPSAVPAQAPSGANVSPTPGNIQANPNNFPHPLHPWNALTRPETRGTPVGLIAVPPQEVVMIVPVPRPEGLPPAWRQEVATVPGYYITETTTGYLYPERWTLEQLNVGVYRWRLLPPSFHRK
jgi:hypothetical protein